MTSPSARAKRVLLLGWDAADWQFLAPLLADGKMPNLQRLIDGGVSGKIATLQPVLSPMLWTSIVTGKLADRHGILGFVEPMPDGSEVRPVSSTSRKVKAIWNILSQSGRRAIVVNWFASHPAEPIQGCVVSNYFPQYNTGDTIKPNAVHPADLHEVMTKLHVNPSQLTPAHLHPFFLNQLPADDDERLQGLAKLFAQCASVHNAATYLAESEEWDFLAVYYDLIDHCGHGFMEFAPPRMDHVSEADFAVFRNVMESCYRYHDLMLGRWMELAGEDTAIVLLSDHGFSSGDGRPLAERGLRTGERPKGANPNPLIWHRQHGVFVMKGPGLKRDGLVHGASLLDVTPTLLAYFDLPMADDMDGLVLTQIFTEPPAVERIPSYEPPHPDDGVIRDAPVEEQDPWAARQAVLQLADLGYVQMPEGDPAVRVAHAVMAKRSNLAQVYFATQRVDQALTLLREMIAEDDNVGFRCREVMCLLALDRTVEAESIIRATMEQTPHFALARLLFGQTLLLLGKNDEGHAVLAAVREAEAQMPLVHLQLGLTYLRQERYPEAEQTFRQVIESDPDSPEAHDGLGVALREQGQIEDAIYEHMRAISLHHERAQTHVNLGISLAMDRQFDWAIRAFHVATELAPQEPFPHRCLARLYFRVKKDGVKAREHATKMLELRRNLRGRTPAFSTGV